MKSCHFTEVHRSFLEKAEYNLNTSISKLYINDGVNATTAELQQTEMRPVSSEVIDFLLYETKVTGVNK